MKTIKITVIAILISSFFFSCGGEDYKAKYKQDLTQFKTDSLSIIKEKFESLKDFAQDFSETEDVFDPKAHKEIEIFIDDMYGYRPMNTIYLDINFFEQDYDHPFELNTYINLCDLRRLINGEQLSFYDEQTPSINYDDFINFKKYCNDFVNAKYIMLQGEIESTAPELDGDEYTAGYIKGLVALYDFQTKKLLDNFLFEAKNSEEIDYTEGESAPVVLYTDFLHNISFTISNEANARYTIDEDAGVPLLSLSQKVIEDYKKEVLKN